jgi:hypothetical protein
MDVHFRHRWSHKGTSASDQKPRLVKFVSVDDAPVGMLYEYSRYLLAGITSDFPEQQLHLCDVALQDIGKLERGEIDAAEWGGTQFCHVLTRSEARLEHAVYGACATWPLWNCSLGQYKAVLHGWREFLAMPAAIDKQLTIALPAAEA